MAWNEQRARGRIERLLGSVPASAIGVRDLEAFLQERVRFRDAALASGARFDEPVFAVSRNQAVTTHGAHVYASLMDFNDHQTERGAETEASHRRSMQFLHAHYAACDQLIAAFGIQRVDFHGPRLHAVVLTPTGDASEATRIETAVAFAHAFRQMVERMTRRYGASLQTRVRVGIDSGAAVAINSGRRGEHEPLFIGSPANHAAKEAEGDEEGVFLARRAQVALQTAPGRPWGTALRLDEATVLARAPATDGRAASAGQRVDEAFAALERQQSAVTAALDDPRRASFDFHHRAPPLRTIDYSDHPPSNAIRMPLVSLFADIAGYTAYVDDAIATGTVGQAVANLHVMRGEMNHVARDDFGGRKVRYVGDCLHAILAEGDARSTDASASVRTGVLAAAGIHSSIELCRAMLPSASRLGIAVGLELGQTPIARLGLRGEASVRCASSRATCLSEEAQSGCAAGQVAIGEAALAAADAHVRRLFDVPGRRIRNPGHAAALTVLAGASAAIPAAAAAAPHILRPAPQEMRAYGR